MAERTASKWFHPASTSEDRRLRVIERAREREREREAHSAYAVCLSLSPSCAVLCSSSLLDLSCILSMALCIREREERLCLRERGRDIDTLGEIQSCEDAHTLRVTLDGKEKVKATPHGKAKWNV